MANDLNLKRRVALKYLPDAFARDPERMARFEREARIEVLIISATGEAGEARPHRIKTVRLAANFSYPSGDSSPLHSTSMSLGLLWLDEFHKR